MRRTSSASRELKASPSSACQGKSAAGMACSSSRPPIRARAVASGSAPLSASATAWAMSDEREVVGEPRRGAQLVGVRSLHELVGRAAGEPSARAEIAAVSHSRPVYAGPRLASGKVGYCPSCTPPMRSDLKTSRSSAMVRRGRSATSGRAATSPATASASCSTSRWTRVAAPTSSAPPTRSSTTSCATRRAPAASSATPTRT